MIVALIAIGIAAMPVLALTWWLERPISTEPRDCAPGCHCRGYAPRPRG